MDWVTPHLKPEWARHALGIGEPVDFFRCIESGIDMFDCVAATRNARRGDLYIYPESGGTPGLNFKLRVINEQYKADSGPIDENCSCSTCTDGHPRAKLRYLHKIGEGEYDTLATTHNLHFMLGLVSSIRNSIIEGRFQQLKQKWLGA